MEYLIIPRTREVVGGWIEERKKRRKQGRKEGRRKGRKERGKNKRREGELQVWEARVE